MRKHSEFSTRQFMQENDFEIFYYDDKNPTRVSKHIHHNYEVYFFLEGDVDYEINQKVYNLSYGSICIIPPKTFHKPHFLSNEKNYRRMVLWINESYLENLKTLNTDIFYGLNYVESNEIYHFKTDFSSFQQLFGKLIDIFEEKQSNFTFQKAALDSMLSLFLVTLNRIVYQYENEPATYKPSDLHISLCNYINTHLEEDLTLEKLAEVFFVSKYHLAHKMKEYMGMSIHQYIIKKRLYACRNNILSGMPLLTVSQSFGFTDYSVFFRAFKKEFGISPKNYKDLYAVESE